MKITIDDCSGSKDDIANTLRKAADKLSPKSNGSKRFKILAGKQIFEHFDNQMKKTIDDIKKDISKILSEK